jgi:hypothetical protein
MLGAIDEKHGVFDIVFLAELKQIIRLGIASGVQPELLVVDPNHRLVEGDLIRTLTGLGL